MVLNTTILARRCHRGRPPHHWKTITVTAGLRANGLMATALFDGATNGKRFRAYVTDTLIPVLKWVYTYGSEASSGAAVRGGAMETRAGSSRMWGDLRV
ncbi:UNVERIFIED_ORG: hypothetical protein M2438_002802 [Methylobacterium sp. SuP10 SLI 274]|nr:hypothetical protein [Methylorubrum extorquens]MDF9792345.1 hypothetical protein [Methylorubrum extorquens]MDF9864034.1 hypothetical protein [Methylorubrum pseudosasae]MDH6637627.1 hypothetical protein [Methylobacterium sp. SuP10 SLI 274]MDH6666807.1 hypothetical protein [Methylorubrum zatmanii]